jgi:enoyl-CoA hydratase/carnithine racemase
MPGSVWSTKEGKVATVTIEHHGRLNALNVAMWRDLERTFLKMADDDEIHCIVIRGAGEAFAAGADISEFPTERYDVESGRNYTSIVQSALTAISKCPQPIVALIKGPCVGGGLEIATRCDLRICDESARFGIPVNRLGSVVAYEELRPLVEIAGPAVAFEILLEGRILTAAEALRKNLVHRCVSGDRLEREVAQTVQRLCDRLHDSVRSIPRIRGSI